MKGEGWHRHCHSCFMQDSLYQDTSGNDYWIELGKSQQRGKSTLWILIGLGQIFWEVKFKIVLILPIKIKKIPREVFWGKIFLPFKFSSQLSCCFPSQLWFLKQPIDYQSRHFFFSRRCQKLLKWKRQMLSCNLTQFCSIWDKDSSRDLEIMGCLLSIRCYDCPSSPPTLGQTNTSRDLSIISTEEQNALM